MILAAIVAALASASQEKPLIKFPFKECLKGVERLYVVTNISGNAVASTDETLRPVAMLPLQEAHMDVRADFYEATPTQPTRTEHTARSAIFEVRVMRLSSDEGLHSALAVTEEVYTISLMNGSMSRVVLWDNEMVVSISGGIGDASVETSQVESLSKMLASDWLAVNKPEPLKQ